MHALLSSLVLEFTFCGSTPEDAAAFLIHHSYPHTADHSSQVAHTAAQVARQFDADPDGAFLAGWLHDISAVVPNAQRLQAAQQLGLEILPEEETVPLLLHQKISAVMARQLFGVEDEQVLHAIGCHTTLHPQPATMDLVLFVADKLAWDQKGTPPYAARLKTALTHSLEEAAWVYQDYLWHSGKIKIIHPWMQASYQELQQRFG